MAERSGGVRSVLAITIVLSACSLLYELLIAQTMSMMAGNTVVWYSLTVGGYLGAMGLVGLIIQGYQDVDVVARAMDGIDGHPGLSPRGPAEDLGGEGGEGERVIAHGCRGPREHL